MEVAEEQSFYHLRGSIGNNRKAGEMTRKSRFGQKTLKIKANQKREPVREIMKLSPEKKVGHICDEHGLELTRLGHLEKHLQRHGRHLSGTNVHTCHQCGIQNSQSHDVRRHVSIHEEKVDPELSDTTTHKQNYQQHSNPEGDSKKALAKDQEIRELKRETVQDSLSREGFSCSDDRLNRKTRNLSKGRNTKEDTRRNQQSSYLNEDDLQSSEISEQFVPADQHIEDYNDDSKPGNQCSSKSEEQYNELIEESVKSLKDKAPHRFTEKQNGEDVPSYSGVVFYKEERLEKADSQVETSGNNLHEGQDFQTDHKKTGISTSTKDDQENKIRSGFASEQNSHLGESWSTRSVNLSVMTPSQLTFQDCFVAITKLDGLALSTKGLLKVTNRQIVGSEEQRVKKIFPCPECDLEFTRPSHLAKHQRVHERKTKEMNGEISYICSFCGFQFNSLLSFKSHMVKHCKDEQQQKKLKVPDVCQRKDKLYPCDKCSIVFTRPSHLMRHLLRHESRMRQLGELGCRFCGVVFQDLLSLRKHHLLHEEAENSSHSQKNGPEAGRVDVPSSDSELHRIRNSEKWPSDVKELSDGGRSELNVEENNMTLEGCHDDMPTLPYTCDFCLTKWLTAEQLLFHMKCHKVKKEKAELLCDECGATYQTVGNLERHKLKHGIENSFVIFEKPGSAKKDPSAAQQEQHCSDDVTMTSIKTAFKGNILDQNSNSWLVLAVSDAIDVACVCDQCNERFRTADELLNHKLSHRRNRTSLIYECPICGNRFGQLSHLNGHLLTHSEMRPHRCCVCGKGFRQLSELHRHSYVHGGIKPFTCDICHKGFAVRSSLKQHYFLHTGQKPFKCALCPKAFPMLHNLENHMMVHTGTRPYACNQCEKRFTASCALKIHMYVHTGEKPYKCNVCFKAFRSKGNLQCHFVVHSGIKAFQCKVCSKHFVASCSLKNHLQLHSGIKPYVCEVCQRPFQTRRSLQTHVLIHSDEKPFSCCACSKSFKTQLSLKQHLLVHSQPGQKHTCRTTEDSCVYLRYCKARALRTHICTICGKGFISPAKLRLHMVTHTKEKTYLCSICGRGFTTGGSLKVHTRTHSGLKPYSCEICGKQFAQIGNLSIHQSIHTGEKPFKCTVCFKAFRLNYRLKTHKCIHKPKDNMKQTGKSKEPPGTVGRRELQQEEARTGNTSSIGGCEKESSKSNAEESSDCDSDKTDNEAGSEEQQGDTDNDADNDNGMPDNVEEVSESEILA